MEEGGLTLLRSMGVDRGWMDDGSGATRRGFTCHDVVVCSSARRYVRWSMVDGWYRLCLHVMGTICYKHVFKSLCIDRTPPPPAINHLVSTIDRSMLDASEPTYADVLHGRRPHRRRPQPRTSALRARAATRRYHGSTCTRTARLPRPPTAQPIPCLLALHGS